MQGYEDIWSMPSEPHATPYFLLRRAVRPLGEREAAKLISVLHMIKDALTKRRPTVLAGECDEEV